MFDLHRLAVLTVGACCLALAGCGTLSESLVKLKGTFNSPAIIGETADANEVTQDGLDNGWLQGGRPLKSIGAGRWVNVSDQAVVEIVCGHVRRWERPGVNLESLSPLQGDPFLVPDPNQLVSAQTWFWVVSVSDDEPRVAQSRYQKTKTDDGGYRIEELWEIRDLNYSATNEYVYTETGIPIEVRQAIHPVLPTVQLSQSGDTECRR